jgi:hypothetical protein
MNSLLKYSYPGWGVVLLAIALFLAVFVPTGWVGYQDSSTEGFTDGSATDPSAGTVAGGHRFFYLTPDSYLGSDMLTVTCAEGYHVASLTEAQGFTVFVYDSELGRVSDDSGMGAPLGCSDCDAAGLFTGWVHSGVDFDLQHENDNCQGWTSSSADYLGKAVYFDERDASLRAASLSCDTPAAVWCVSDTGG